MLFKKFTWRSVYLSCTAVNCGLWGFGFFDRPGRMTGRYCQRGQYDYNNESNIIQNMFSCHNYLFELILLMQIRLLSFMGRDIMYTHQPYFCNLRTSSAAAESRRPAPL